MMWSSADCFFLQSLVWIVISLQQVSVGNALGNERMPASSQYSVFSSFSEEEKTMSGFSRIHQLANKAQELVNNNKQQSQSQQQHQQHQQQQQQHLLFRTLQEEDSSATTIDFVCNTLLNSTFATEYERDNANCACDYEGNDSGTTNPTDGIYVLTCRYDYCQECIVVVDNTDTDTDTDTDICGVQVNQNIISVVSPNVYFLAGSYCVELTSSNTNTDNGMMMMPTTPTCFDFSLDPTDVGMTTTSTQCRVTVGDEECNSCDFVDCNGTALAEFDCLNIGSGNTGGGIQASLCNLDNSNFPINSPFSVFRDDIYSFDSCISSAATIPEPTLSPTTTTTTTTLPTIKTNMPTTNTTSNMPTTTSLSSSLTIETLTSSTSTTSLAPTTTSSSILSVVVDTTDGNRTTTTADEPTVSPTNSFTIQEQQQQQQQEAEAAAAAAASPSPTEVKRSSASSSSSSSSSFKQSSVTPWTFSLSIMTVLTATFIV